VGQPAPAAIVHGLLQPLDRGVAAGEGGCGPLAGGEDHQGVEDIGVEARGVREGVMASLDGRPQPGAQCGVAFGVVGQVRDAERDVPGLVLVGESHDLAGDRVGGVLVEEGEQVQEAALAQHREQERGQREVRFGEQRGKRRPPADRGGPQLSPVQERPAREHLDVPGLTADLPSSLTPATYQLLREEYGFDGLVLTDDLGAMKAVTGTFELPDAVELALAAGADMALWTTADPVPPIVDALEIALVDGRLDAAANDRAVERILAAKHVCGR